jgi:hypothetical protein
MTWSNNLCNVPRTKLQLYDIIKFKFWQHHIKERRNNRERERERERGIERKKVKNRKIKKQENEFGIKRFAPSVVSSSSPVVAHIMVTGGLHDR